MSHYQPSTQTIPCSGCRIGQMRPVTVTYFTFARGRMITLPDFPAWECDICKKCEYDVDALEKLALLLHPPVQYQRPAQRSKNNGDTSSPNSPLPK